MKRKAERTHILVLLTMLLLAASALFANGDSEVISPQWNKTYGEPGLPEYAYSVVQSTDGGYLVGGRVREQPDTIYKYSWLVKIDAEGNMQWNKTIGQESIMGATCLIKTTDGGYAIASDQVSSSHIDTFCLATINSAGEMQWNRTFGNGLGGGQCIVQTSEGGFAIAQGGQLVKTDSSGVIQWSQNYPGIQNVILTHDGGFAMTGIMYAGADYHIWLAKADSIGNMQFNKTFVSWGTKEAASSLVQTTDGGFAVAGDLFFSTSVWSDILFFKTDSVGNLEWGKTYGNPYADWAASMVQTTDGGYAMACFTSYADFTLLKIDSNGNQQWFKKYLGYSGPNYVRCIIQTNDGGFAMTGNGHPQIVNAPEDFWLVKTDSGGNNPNASDISVPITGSFPLPSPSPSPTLLTEPSPLRTPSPTFTASPSPSPTPSPEPQQLEPFPAISVVAVAVSVAVVGAGLLVYFRKRKSNCE